MEKINSVLVRYGEIGIKGLNRVYFEKKLIKNIKDCLIKNKINFSNIERYAGRIIIYTNNKCLPLKNVFGISSFSPAIKIELNLDKIKQESLKLYTKGSFRISAQRLNKKFALTSNELNKNLGEFIVKNKKAKVNLEKPNCDIGIEIMDDAYLFNERYNGLGGLPVNSEGLVTLILDSKNSLLAGILMLKRGCSLEIIEQKNINYKILNDYSYGSRVNIVSKPSNYSKAIVKVSSLKYMKSKLYNLPVFNPLIGNEKNREIRKELFN